jgi:hypothetical protein
MRRLLIALAISLLPSVAIAHGHGGHSGGGHMGHSMSGARVGGPAVGQMGARVSGPVSGQMGARVATNMGGRWGVHGGAWAKNGIHHGHHHRHARFFFAGGPWFASYGYGYDCWQWTPTPWGLRRVWACDYY